VIKFTHLIKDHLLYEGLIYSVSIDTFEDMVNRWAIVNDGIKITSNRSNNKIFITFLRTPTPNDADNLLKIINNLGWFVSAYCNGNTMKWGRVDKDTLIDRKNLHSFQIEAKFDLDVSDCGFDILYHITPSVDDNKIQKIGLVPKSLSKVAYHPERIYFTKTPEATEIIAKQFHKLNKDTKHFSIYKVDIKSAIRNNSQLRLFKDPNFVDGIYTLSNIRPKNIEFIREIEIS